jgi:hypothetical protein
VYRTKREHYASDLTDEELKHQIERIRPLITRWPQQLGLGQWLLTFGYARSGAEDSGGREGGKWGTMAEVQADWRYKQAYVTFYMPQVSQTDDSELEYAFVHELCHILVNELRGPKLEYKDGSNGRAREESVVTAMAKAYLWVRDSVLTSPTRWCDCKEGQCTHHDEEGEADRHLPFPDRGYEPVDNAVLESLSGTTERASSEADGPKAE